MRPDVPSSELLLAKAALHEPEQTLARMLVQVEPQHPLGASDVLAAHHSVLAIHLLVFFPMLVSYNFLAALTLNVSNTLYLVFAAQ